MPRLCSGVSRLRPRRRRRPSSRPPVRSSVASSRSASAGCPRACPGTAAAVSSGCGRSTAAGRDSRTTACAPPGPVLTCFLSTRKLSALCPGGRGGAGVPPLLLPAHGEVVHQLRFLTREGPRLSMDRLHWRPLAVSTPRSLPSSLLLLLGLVLRVGGVGWGADAARRAGAAACKVSPPSRLRFAQPKVLAQLSL